MAWDFSLCDIFHCLSTSATLPNVNITPLNFATCKNVATNPSAGRDLRRKKACEHGQREETEEKDKQWAMPRETLHSSLSCFLFYTMLKFPILRPRLIAKLETQAWRGPVMNSAPDHAMELAWWRPCHCQHRAQSSQCGQLPPLTWEGEHSRLPGITLHLRSAWWLLLHDTGLPFKVWWVHLMGSASVKCPCLHWKGDGESVQTSSASRVGGRLYFLLNREMVQKLGTC